MTVSQLSRVSNLAHVLEKKSVAAFLAWSPITMGYLHGLFENAHERFLVMAISAKGELRLICPALTATQAKRVGVHDIRSWEDGEDPLTHFKELISDWGLEGKAIAIDADMPAQQLLKIQGVCSNQNFSSGAELLSKVMRVKSDDELLAMQRAADIADAVDLLIPEIVKVGMTEEQVAQRLTEEMNQRGGKTKFSIIAAGANGAEPHHMSDSTVLKNGDIVILDFGCEYEGYQSDITRTVSLGPATSEAKEIYDVVLRAHHAARHQANIGNTCESVDLAARSVIEAAGYGEFFIHRTGHGIGMQGHEEPNIVKGNLHGLENRNCFSIEPGIYLPGRFGVRIENICTVKDGVCYSFNQEPSPTLIEI